MLLHYFIHVVRDTDESLRNVLQQKFYAHIDFEKLEGTLSISNIAVMESRMGKF